MISFSFVVKLSIATLAALSLVQDKQEEKNAHSSSIAIELFATLLFEKG